MIDSDRITTEEAGAVDPLLAPVAHETLPALLHEALTRGSVITPTGERVPLGSNISLEEAWLLYRCVSHLQPATSVEIGLAQGVSTLAILHALEMTGTGEHHVIDPFQKQYQNCGLAVIGRAGLSQRLRFHEQFPEEVIPGLGPVQFCFIDSSHLFDFTVMEFVLLDKKLTVGGVIGLHDLWMPAQQKVLRYILSNRRYRLIPTGSSRRPWQHRFKLWLAASARLIPAHRRIFRPEILRPWPAFPAGNLALLQKLEPDQRDWRFHQPF